MGRFWPKSRYNGRVMAREIFFYQCLWVTKFCAKFGCSQIPRTASMHNSFIVLRCMWKEPAPLGLWYSKALRQDYLKGEFQDNTGFSWKELSSKGKVLGEASGLQWKDKKSSSSSFLRSWQIKAEWYNYSAQWVGFFNIRMGQIFKIKKKRVAGQAQVGLDCWNKWSGISGHLLYSRSFPGILGIWSWIEGFNILLPELLFCGFQSLLWALAYLWNGWKLLNFQ